MTKRTAFSSPLSSLLVLLTILAGGALLLTASVQNHPFANPSSLDLTGLAAPTPLRLFATLRTLTWLALINACAWTFGTLIESELPLPTRLSSLRPIFRLGVGLALISLGVLTLASLHQLTAPGFALLVLAPPATWAARRGLRRGRTEAASRRPRMSRLVVWVWIGYALLLAGACLRALGDDVGWDALTYHLAFPARYLDENGIFMTPFSHLSGYIASTEMLYLLALAFDGARLAVLINFEFGLLILAVVWIYARRTSLRAAIIAPLFLLADPLFQQELGWAYDDLSLALYTTLSAVALHTWFENETDRISLVYAGLFIGMACAIRYLGATFGLALVALVWLPPRHRKLRKNFEASLLLTALSIAVMTPWMIRNAVFTGNPVTPLLQFFFYAPGSEYIRPIVMRQSAGFLRFVGMGRDLSALIALPWNLPVRSIPGTYMNSFGFQVGPLYAVGLIAALLVGDVRRSAIVKSMLKLVAIFTLLWFYSFQEARFLIPTFPLIATAGAIGIDRAASIAKPWGRTVLLLPIVAALYCQLLFLSSLPNEYASVFEAPEKAAQRAPGATAAASFLSREMHDGDKLMLWLEERAFYFRGLDYIPYHIGSGSPLLALVHRLPNERALQCGLNQIGVTHVLINRSFRRASPGLFVEGYGQAEFVRDLNRVDNLMRAEGKVLFEKDGVEIYRLSHTRCD